MKRNLKTTLAGIAALAVVAAAHFFPQYLGGVEKIVGLLSGLGLIAAQDAR